MWLHPDLRGHGMYILECTLHEDACIINWQITSLRFLRTRFSKNFTIYLYEKLQSFLWYSVSLWSLRRFSKNFPIQIYYVKLCGLRGIMVWTNLSLHYTRKLCIISEVLFSCWKVCYEMIYLGPDLHIGILIFTTVSTQWNLCQSNEIWSILSQIFKNWNTFLISTF